MSKRSNSGIGPKMQTQRPLRSPGPPPPKPPRKKRGKLG
jgi:hypothetical protein